MSAADAIVIGAGLSGLTTAAALAKWRGDRVVVFERSTSLGGCAQVFSRRSNYKFDVGVHFVTGMSEGSLLRRDLDSLLDGRVGWKRIPDTGELYHFGEEKFSVPCGLVELSAALRGYFPESSAEIDRYVAIVASYARAYDDWMSKSIAARTELERRFHRAVYRWRCPWAELPITEVFARLFENPKLRAICSAQWPPLGTYPERVAFGFYCSHIELLSRGVFYPENGAENLLASLVREIETAGGEVHLGVPVERLLLENGRVTGVEANGERHRARTVVSSISKERTRRLIAPEGARRAEAAGLSYLMLFAGLREDPRNLGLDLGGHWIFADFDFGGFFPGDPVLASVRNVYVSSPSLRRESGYHTLELGLAIDRTAFEKWSGTDWKKRGEEYEAFKRAAADQILSVVDARYPGLRAAVSFQEVSTPLTVRHFVPELDENIRLFSPEKLLAPERCVVRARTRGLYYTGSEVTSPGVCGVLLSGFATARIVLRDRGAR